LLLRRNNKYIVGFITLLVALRYVAGE